GVRTQWGGLRPWPGLRAPRPPCGEWHICGSRWRFVGLPYGRFATPVPPQAGQVVTWVSRSRKRFGNSPSGESSHDSCPPPWQIGHCKISSSAIQRYVGCCKRMFALQTNSIIYVVRPTCTRGDDLLGCLSNIFQPCVGSK